MFTVDPMRIARSASIRAPLPTVVVASFVVTPMAMPMLTA
jgi:hypothetical protein